MKSDWHSMPAVARAVLVACGLAAAPVLAGSIQQPGLTTGLAEGYGLTEGLYSVTAANLGFRNSDPKNTTSATVIPMFITWATPVEIADARLLVKAAPLVYVALDTPGLKKNALYSPYAGAWLSWYLGNGWNVAVGEGAQIGVANDLTRAVGRDFTAFQQNVALSYVRDNWNVTANTFYTTGRNRPEASQPRTFNVDLTAIKRDGRWESGFVGYGQWDVNSPSVGYGARQREIAVGWLCGYLIGNQMSLQAKLTTDLEHHGISGRDTRAWLQLIVPLWTPPAPAFTRASDRNR